MWEGLAQHPYIKAKYDSPYLHQYLEGMAQENPQGHLAEAEEIGGTYSLCTASRSGHQDAAFAGAGGSLWQVFLHPLVE